MGFSDFTTTTAGREMIAEGVAGGRLTLTKIQIGAGEITLQAPEAMTALINPVLDVQIASKKVKQGSMKDGTVANYASIQGHFKTSSLKESFYFREIGVFARIDDGEERLFLYNNAYALADYIDKNARETQDRTLVIPVFIGSVKEVYIEISEDLTYVTTEEFQDHVKDTLPHLPPGGTAGQFLQRTETGTAWANVSIPPDFDNLLAWSGCTRHTPKKEENTWTEQIVTTEGNILRAERITVKNGEEDYTETYRFYAADGETITGKYTVHTTKDGTETWHEVIDGEGEAGGTGCGSGGGTGDSVDFATDEEVNAMLDEVFGKVDYEEEEEGFATDEEVNAMLDEVFGVI